METEGWAHRLGRKAGRGWSGYVRRERQVVRWLVARGVPARGAIAMLWILKLLMLGVLFYVAFWLALLLVCVMVVAWILPRGFKDNVDEQTPVVPDDLNELRKTPGYDPNLYNDTSHEMYDDDR